MHVLLKKLFVVLIVYRWRLVFPQKGEDAGGRCNWQYGSCQLSQLAAKRVPSQQQHGDSSVCCEQQQQQLRWRKYEAGSNQRFDVFKFEYKKVQKRCDKLSKLSCILTFNRQTDRQPYARTHTEKERECLYVWVCVC